MPNCCASRASFFGCRARQHFPCLGARARARVGDANQRPWPADKVERWAIDRLIPYAKNARTHTDAQVAAIAASIKEWGWTTPALVGEDGGLIAGHARILAARQLGIAEIPVMVAAGWSEAQKRAYVAGGQSAGDYRFRVGPAELGVDWSAYDKEVSSK